MFLKIAKTITLAAILATATMTVLAQGADTYKAKCQMCHGASGLADSGAGKAMHVKPITDPEVQKQSEAQMIEAVTNGSGKMQAFKGKLTETEIKDAVSYFRSFIK
jgi:mono/diheme cytochrome c family protein